MQRKQTTLLDPSLNVPPLLLSVPQTAGLLSIGVTFAWELVRSGALPSIKLGRRVLVPHAAVEQFARAGTARSAACEPVRVANHHS